MKTKTKYWLSPTELAVMKDKVSGADGWGENGIPGRTGGTGALAGLSGKQFGLIDHEAFRVQMFYSYHLSSRHLPLGG